jgi:hydrogenase/urease accessory protein HupE
VLSSSGSSFRLLAITWNRLSILVATFLAGAGISFAHDPFSSSTTAQINPENLVLHVAMAHSAARNLLDQPPVATDQKSAAGQFESDRAPFAKRALSLYSITAAGSVLRPIDASANLTAENDVEFEIRYPLPTAGPLRFRALFLTQLVKAHVASLYVENSRGEELGWGYLEADTPILEVPLSADTMASTASVTNAPPTRPHPVTPSFRSFLKLGVEHILTGYDHLLFLTGLLLACRRFATMAGIVTCFTIAHSITLALAALDVVTLPSHLVEPLIAGTIVFVGVENLLRRGAEPKGRWALTFAFGLVHGFGFASALKEIGLGTGSALLAPLFSFNLGVEIGQIAVAVILLPLLLRLRRSADFVRYGLPAASVVVVLLGTYWLLERTVLA